MNPETQSQYLAEYLADPEGKLQIPRLQETHPITGDNALSWPIIPHRFELPVPNVRAAWLSRVPNNIFLHGSIDLLHDKLQYGNRVEVGQSIGVGNREVIPLTNITNVVMEDLGTTPELLGLSKVTVLLPSDDSVTMILNHRNCRWPKDTTNMQRGEYTGISAIEQSLNAYRHVARIGFERFARENGLEDFYLQWAFLYQYRGQVTPRMPRDMREQLGLPDNFSMRDTMSQEEIQTLVRESFYTRWTEHGVLLP